MLAISKMVELNIFIQLVDSRLENIYHVNLIDFSLNISNQSSSASHNHCIRFHFVPRHITNPVNKLRPLPSLILCNFCIGEEEEEEEEDKC